MYVSTQLMQSKSLQTMGSVLCRRRSIEYTDDIIWERGNEVVPRSLTDWTTRASALRLTVISLSWPSLGGASKSPAKRCYSSYHMWPAGGEEGGRGGEGGL